MLSLKRGDPIAQCTKGKSEATVRIFGKDTFVKQEPDLKIDANERIELVPKSFLKEHKANKQQVQAAMEAGTELGQEADELVQESLRTNISLPDFQCFPIAQNRSERLFISGPSGSGKSTMIGEYCRRLQAKEKKRKIYVFSRVLEDAPLDALKHVTRVPLEEKFWSWVTLRPEDFESSILVFDDIDTILDKNLLKRVRAFRDDCLECGRHYGLTVICACHLLTDFSRTRTIINEAMAVCVFPRGSGQAAIQRFLESYLGLGREMIRELCALPTRWLWFNKTYPRFVVWQSGARLL